MRGIEHPLIYLNDDNFFEFCNNNHIDTSFKFEECKDTYKGIIYNIPNTQFSVCLNIAEKDLKYLIMDDLTPLGVDIKELRNIVIFYNDCWGEGVAAFILYRVLGCITSLDTEDLDYCLEQYVGKVCDEDYFTLFTKQLNIVIDPLLEDYVDYRSYIIEHFTLAEYKDDIYVFNLY